MKIGILTLPFGANYGCLLQSYALYTYLAQQGHEVVVLSRGWNRSSYGIIYSIKRWIYYNVICRHLYRFYKKIERTPLLRSGEELKNYVIKNGIEVVVVGSDQVWRVKNTRGADLNFFLDFLKDESSIRKISYAASFGIDQFDGTELEKTNVKQLIQLFDHVSVREQSGVDICRTLFDRNVDLVVDPTLLLEPETYRKLFDSSNCLEGNKIVTYILDASLKKDALVKALSDKLNLQIEKLYEKKIQYKSVERWLKSIAEAKFVVVDSFHGMLFSIIFNKQFIVINNAHRGSTRFMNVLNKLDLSIRCVAEEEISEALIKSILSQEIDYNILSQKMKSLKSDSIQILNEYLRN